MILSVSQVTFLGDGYYCSFSPDVGDYRHFRLCCIPLRAVPRGLLPSRLAGKSSSLAAFPDGFDG